VLFDHSTDERPTPVLLSAAARALVCTQAYCFSGGGGKYSNSPLVAGAVFWLRGRSLFEALLLNAPPSERARMGEDPGKPVWAREVKPARKRAHEGLLDYLTWPSRRVRFVVEDGPDGEPRAIRVWYNQGDKVETTTVVDDPAMAFEPFKEAARPLTFKADRALWRDAAVFLMARREGAEKGAHAPRIFEWISDPANLRRLGAAADVPWQADVFGMANEQAKVELWRHERVPVYPAVLDEPARWDHLVEAMKAADKEAKRLGEAVKHLAKHVRGHEWAAFAGTLAAEPRYWSALDAPFFDFLKALATAPLDALGAPLDDWKKGLRKASLAALRAAAEPLARRARMLQALAEAETLLLFGTLHPKPKRAPAPAS
jgi:CRISPR system Cascade subunit CasA